MFFNLYINKIFTRLSRLRVDRAGSVEPQSFHFPEKYRLEEAGI